MRKVWKWMLPLVTAGILLWPNSSIAQTPVQEREPKKNSYYLLAHGGANREPVSWVKFSSSRKIHDPFEMEFEGEYFDAKRNVCIDASGKDGLKLKLNLMEKFSLPFGRTNIFLKAGVGLQGTGNGFENVQLRTPYKYGLETQVSDNGFFYFQNSTDMKLEIGIKFKF